MKRKITHSQPMENARSYPNSSRAEVLRIQCMRINAEGLMRHPLDKRQVGGPKERENMRENGGRDEGGRERDRERERERERERQTETETETERERVRERDGDNYFNLPNTGTAF